MTTLLSMVKEKLMLKLSCPLTKPIYRGRGRRGVPSGELTCLWCGRMESTF